MNRTAPYLLLLLIAAIAGSLVLLTPNPGTRHTDRPTLVNTAAQQADPIARPAMPIPADQPDGSDAGLITGPAPHVIPLPGGATPIPEAPRPVDSPADVDSGPVCLMAGCTPPADPTCPDGEQDQGELGCVAVQLPEETDGRATDPLPETEPEPAGDSD